MASPQGIADAMLQIERLGTGYSQGRRWSFVADRNARPLLLQRNRAADCSSAAGAAAVLAGYPVDLSGTFYTGNQRQRLVAAGAQDLLFSRASAQVGDILWRDGHTEVVTAPGVQTGARIDENGNITGGRDGDQTGWEFASSPLSNNWTRILRFHPTNTNTDTGGFLMALTDKQQTQIAKNSDVLAYSLNAQILPVLGRLDRGLVQTKAELAAIKATVAQLGAGQGVSAEAITKAIDKAVSDALAGIEITLTAEGK
jgi:hypothetical protein